MCELQCELYLYIYNIYLLFILFVYIDQYSLIDNSIILENKYRLKYIITNVFDSNYDVIQF